MSHSNSNKKQCVATNQNDSKVFYLVEQTALPDVIIKTILVKQLLNSGQATNVMQATTKVGISRSAYYKYRDLVFMFNETTKGKTITLAMNLRHVAGLLSMVLNAIADFGANVLTINQNIPLNNIANVTITCEMEKQETPEKNANTLLYTLQQMQGVEALKIIAKE